MIGVDTQQHRIAVNGIELHVVTAGPQTGHPVILLHGFPDFWYGWRHQIEALTARGFRLIMPDQRGYGASDKPVPTGAYDIVQLTNDILQLMDAMGLARASLIGHDFGGAVAWWIAANFPDRVDRLVVLNCPHFSVYRRAHLGLGQAMRSWYVLTFLVPGLSEAMCQAREYAALVRIGPGTRTGGMRPVDLAPYHEAWGRPGALRGMLSWYRAMIPALLRRFPAERIRPPTLLIWGKRDPALACTMARPSIELCERGELVVLDDENHWLHWDAPDRVNQLITGWLTAPASQEAMARS